MASIPVIESSETIKLEMYHYLRDRFPNPLKKILFAVPPETPENLFDESIALAKRYPLYPPYGPGILCSNLLSRGYNSKIIDLNYEVISSVHNNKEFSYIDYIFKLNELIKNYNPDIICISIIFTNAFQEARRICSNIKDIFPEKEIFAGGIAVSNDIKHFLESFPEVTLAFSFEGDEAFPDAIDVINGIKGHTNLKQCSSIIDGVFATLDERSPPLEGNINLKPEYQDLPIQSYSLYGSVGQYSFKFKRKDTRASSVLTNRGCRARCSFCAVRNFNGIGVRQRSIQSVVDEIQHLKEYYGITHITWLDDDLLKDQDRIISLFNEITERKLGITWDASNGLIAGALTDEIISAASKSGCIGFHLGLESGNDEILRKIHKPGNTKAYYRAAEIMRRYPNIYIKGYTIIGFPGETIAQIKNTIKVFVDLEFHWYPLQLLTPVAGTEITQEMESQGLIDPSSKETTYRGMAAGSKSGKGGALRAREVAERINAKPFVNLLETLPDDHVPSSNELEEIWFVADYKLNYEKILFIKDLDKLSEIRNALIQITDSFTKENALGNTFLYHIEKILGNQKEADIRKNLANSYLRDSAYWRARFESFDIYKVLS
jgi:radical SAM superfamily enzyme YgiQ (UPF0313 family)